MAHRLVRFLISALIAVALIAGLRFYQSKTGEADPAFGSLNSHFLGDSTAPLQYPESFQPAVAEDRLVPAEAAGGRPRNLILIIGDGMGVGSLSAADALLDNPTGSLTMTASRHLGLVRTWAANDLTTDSAASATALSAGIKTNKKMIGMTPDGRRAINFFEAARKHGMATGVITTSGLADATPAAFTIHIDHRDKYHEILPKVLASGTDLMIGGNWVNKDKAIINPPYLSLVDEIEELAAANGLNLVTDPAGIDEAELPLLAFYPPRPEAPMDHGPSLADSTRLAIDLLSADPDGFVLVVESETTDEGGHSRDIDGVLSGVRELDGAVAAALDRVGDRNDTLILVTADHDTGSAAITEGSYEEAEATIRWSSDEHSSQFVALLAFGPGAERFTGFLDNTEIPRVAARLLGLEDLPQMADEATD